MVMLLGESKGIITLDVSDLSAKASQATGDLAKLDTASGGMFGSLDQQLRSVGMTTDQLGKGMIGFGVALGAPIAIGIKAAADLEQSFVNVKAALDDVTPDQFERLKSTIIDIGANGQYSAQQIAAVSEELAKAGRTVEEQIGGNMLQAVSDLSSATGTDLMVSVKGINSAMAIWGTHLEDTSLHLTDASRVADIFTFAANKSSASVEDIMAGMRNLGPIAATMGVPFEEAAATIAMFTNSGVKATVAGTALNTAITRLADPTSEASALMEQFGIDAFDAQGKFIGFPAMFDNLAVAMQGMSMEQKAATLATVFGLEAMDAMALAALNGGDAIRELIITEEDYGIASTQAAERTKTLHGAWERLTEGLTVFLALLSGGLVGPLTVLANALDAVIAVVSGIPAPILAAIGTIMGLTSVLLIAGGTALLAYPKIQAFLMTMRALAATQGPLQGVAAGMFRVASAAKVMALALSGIGLLAGAVFIAWRHNLFGFQDWIRSTFSDVFDFVNGLTGDFQTQQETVTRSFNGMVETVNNADGTRAWFYTELDDNGTPQRIGEIIDSKEDLEGDGMVEVLIATEDGEYWTWIDLNTGQIVGEATVEVEAKDKRNSFQKINDRLETLKRGFRDRGWKIPAMVIGGVQKLVSGVGSLSQWWDLARQRASTFFTLFDAYRYGGKGFFESIKLAGARAFAPIIDAARGVGGALADAFVAIPGILKSVGRGAVSLGRWTLDTAAPTVKGWLKRAGKSAWDGLTNAAGWAWRKGTQIKNWALDVAAPKVAGWISRAGKTAWEGISSAAGWVGGKAVALKDWTLDTAKPKVRGWLASIGNSAMDFIAGAKDFIADTVELADWAIDAAKPTVMGWLAGAGDSLWSLLSAAAGLAGGLIASLGAWTLDTAAPAVGGWLAGLVGDAWGAIKDAVGWEGSFSATVDSWDLDIPSPEDVLGWIQEFIDDPWGTIVDAAYGEDGELRFELKDWTLEVDEPDVNKWLDDFDAWFLEQFGMSPGNAVVKMHEWTLDVGIPTTITVTQDIGVLIADFIGGVAVGIGNVLLSVMFSKEFTVLGWDADRIIENGLGYLAERGIDVLVDIMWSFVRDPLSSLERTLALTFLSGLVVSAAIVGFWPTILPIALAALAITIYNQLRDYFERNPQKIDELKVEIGKMWAELEDGKFGLLFTGLRKIGEAAVWAVEKARAFDNWLDGLPGPLSDAYGWVKKLTLALIALQAVSLAGGFAPGAKGKNSKGFIGGLMSGLWMLASFPFRLAFNPVKTLKNLFKSKPGGAGGGAQSWLARGAGLLLAIAKSPFRMISNGFKAMTGGFGAFAKGFNRTFGAGVKNIRWFQRYTDRLKLTVKSLGSGFSALWGHMKGGQNVMGRLFRGMSKFRSGIMSAFGVVQKLFWNAPMRQIGSRIISLFYLGLSGLSSVFTTFFRGASKAFVDGMRAIFTTKFGIVQSPKAFAAFSMLSNLLGKLRGSIAKILRPLARLTPFLSRLGPLARLAVSPLALLARGAVALIPALAAIPGIGWIILGVIALVIAAIVAWKTNFLGFRDAMQAVGRGIGTAVAWIVGQFEEFVGGIQRLRDAFDEGGWSNVFSVFGEMLQGGLRNIGEGLGTAIRWIGEQLWNGLQAAYDRISNFDLGSAASSLWNALWGAVTGISWSGIWDWITSTLGDLDLGSLASKGMEFIGSLLRGMVDALPKVLFWLGSLAGKAVRGIGSLAGTLISKGVELITGLWSGMDLSWGKVLLFLALLPISIPLAIGSLIGTLVSKGIELISGFLEGVNLNWQTVATFFAGIGGKVAAAIPDLAAYLVSAGLSLISGFLDGLGLNWTQVETFLASIPGKATSAVGMLGDLLVDKGKSFLGGLYRGAINYWNGTIKPWFTGIGDKIIGILPANPGSIMTTFANGLMEGFSSKIDEWISTITTKFENFINTLIGWYNKIAAVSPGLEPMDFIGQKGMEQDRIAWIDHLEQGVKWSNEIYNNFRKSLGLPYTAWVNPEPGPGGGGGGGEETKMTKPPIDARSADDVKRWYQALTLAEQVTQSLGGEFVTLGTGVARTNPTFDQLRATVDRSMLGARASVGVGSADITTKLMTGSSRAAIGYSTNLAQLAPSTERPLYRASASSGTISGQITSKLSAGAKNAASGYGKGIAPIPGTTTSVGSKAIFSAGAAGNGISNGFRTGAARAPGQVQSALGGVPGAVSSSGARAAISAFGVGVNIGQSLASGIRSQIGAVRSAAAALSAAAVVSSAAKLMIGSPSKVFIRQGSWIGEGMKIGIRKMIPAVAAAARDLVTMPSISSLADRFSMPDRPSWLGSGSAPSWMPSQSGGNTYNTYNNDIRVTPHEGESVTSFAYRVASIIVGAENTASEGTP